MKICIIELMPFPYTVGGVPAHIKGLTEQLVLRGHEVNIISSRPNRCEPKYKIAKSVKIYNVGLPHKIFGQSNGLSRFLEYIYRFFFELSFFIGATKTLLKIKPDVVNVESLLQAFPCIIMGQNFISTQHGVHSAGFSKLWCIKGEKTVSKVAKFYKLIEYINSKFCKKIICLGKDTHNYYKNFCDCEIIPNGVDLTEFNFKKNKDKKLIISIGRITKQKAIDKLVSAMKFLPNYKLMVIGAGPELENIKRLADKNCVFLGYVENIKPFMEKAQFTVLPSEFEGLPIAMLEQMACGVIPIATPVGDIKDVIRDAANGFLLKDNSPETIVKALYQTEKYDLKRISLVTRKTIEEKYNWSKLVNKFIKIYQECAK